MTNDELRALRSLSVNLEMASGMLRDAISYARMGRLDKAESRRADAFDILDRAQRLGDAVRPPNGL